MCPALPSTRREAGPFELRPDVSRSPLGDAARGSAIFGMSNLCTDLHSERRKGRIGGLIAREPGSLCCIDLRRDAGAKLFARPN